MRNEDRTAEFRRNQRLETALAALNSELQTLSPAADHPRHPVVLIVGCARSGTTLLLQWLGAGGRFAYPTNLIARFHGAPWIGARVQQILTDPEYACGEELGDLVDPGNGDWYQSRLGKTRGLLAPSEFWYFWRRFFPLGDASQLDEESWDPALGRRFTAELAAWESVADRPLAMKAGILNWNLPLLGRLLPRAIFLHVHRDPVANMQSLLLARRAYFGRDDLWYSFKPPQYRQLAGQTVPDQLAGQVQHTERAIREGLAQLLPQRVLTVAYEDFCGDPAQVHADLADRLRGLGGPDLGPYAGPASFDVSHTVRIGNSEYWELAAAWAVNAAASSDALVTDIALRLAKQPAHVVGPGRP